MRKILLISLVFLFISSICAISSYYTYYKIELNYQNGELNTTKTDIIFSDVELTNPSGRYSASLKDFDGKVLKIVSFDVQDKILWDSFDPKTGEIISGGEKIVNKTSFEVYIPYNENASEIIIYDENFVEKTKIDVSMYSSPESKTLWEEAQESREKVNKSESIAEGPKEDKGVKKIEENFVDYWWILVIILIALIVVLIVSWRNKEKS